MNISWSFHELTKETDRIANVGSNDCEVETITNKLLIVCRLTLCGVVVGIQFEVSVERGSNGLTLCYPNSKSRLRI